MATSEMFRRTLYSNSKAKSVLIFACPFGTKSWMFKPLINRLRKMGYEVIAYDFNDDVFYAGDATYLPEVIKKTLADIEKKIASYESKRIKDFGFMGASLGGFVMYNAIAQIPQLKWGVFIAGGNVSEAIWKFRKSKKQYSKKGLDPATLAQAWHHLQYPDFKNDMIGNHYLFFGSEYDTIVPLRKLHQYLIAMRKAGAKVDIVEVKSPGHNLTAIVGFARCRKLLKLARGNVTHQSSTQPTGPR